MPTDVARCRDHGFHEGESCPVCGAVGEPILDGNRRRQLSKFLSGALRHFPADAGLSLDGAGWTPFASLVEAAERTYDWATAEHVAGVVATDPKGRFEVRGDGDDRTVRAAYGHSVDVTLEAGDDPVPDSLYHGTARRTLEPILDEGLRPMGRQEVHLSGTVEDARAVGLRHDADPIVLEVDAATLLADGYTVTERAEGTYTTKRVPPAYLSQR